MRARLSNRHVSLKQERDNAMRLTFTTIAAMFEYTRICLHHGIGFEVTQRDPDTFVVTLTGAF